MRTDRTTARTQEHPWAIVPGMLPAVADAVRAQAAGERQAPALLAALTGGRGATSSNRARGSVAILGLYGVIVPRAGGLAEYLGGTSAERFTARLRDLVNDSDVSAIIIDTYSPGGDVAGVDEASRALFDARGTKPIVAIANHLMASAAYWIASAADQVVATPSAEVGSIGVYAAHFDYSKAERLAGIKTTLVSKGRHKTDGNPYEPLTDQGRDTIQGRVDDYYSAFVAAVARNRNTAARAVREGFGQGRTAIGIEAVRLGLADRVETLAQLVTRLSDRPAAPRFGGSADGQQLPKSSAARADLDLRRRRARALSMAQ